MGIIGKAILAGGAYYLYKQRQEKKRAERGEVGFSNHQQQREAPNDYYPHDNKPQYTDNNAYPRDGKRELEYPQSNPSYQSFEPKREYSGADVKY